MIHSRRHQERLVDDDDDFLRCPSSNIYAYICSTTTVAK